MAELPSAATAFCLRDFSSEQTKREVTRKAEVASVPRNPPVQASDLHMYVTHSCRKGELAVYNTLSSYSQWVCGGREEVNNIYKCCYEYKL